MQDNAGKSSEPGAAGATWGRAIGQTVKQVSIRNVLIYVIMQEICIVLLVKTFNFKLLFLCVDGK